MGRCVHGIVDTFGCFWYHGATGFIEIVDKALVLLKYHLGKLKGKKQNKGST